MINKKITLRNIIFIIMFAILYGLPARAQTAVKLVNNTYTQVTKQDTSKPTGKTFKAADGTLLPVYQSAKGKFYVLRTSKKTGNQYKQYLKIQE